MHGHLALPQPDAGTIWETPVSADGLARAPTTLPEDAAGGECRHAGVDPTCWIKACTSAGRVGRGDGGPAVGPAGAAARTAGAPRPPCGVGLVYVHRLRGGLHPGAPRRVDTLRAHRGVEILDVICRTLRLRGRVYQQGRVMAQHAHPALEIGRTVLEGGVGHAAHAAEVRCPHFSDQLFFGVGGIAEATGVRERGAVEPRGVPHRVRLMPISA